MFLETLTTSSNQHLTFSISSPPVVTRFSICDEMAKKKSNANVHRQPEDLPQKTVTDDRADNDGEMEKVKNLKSLNAVLVKQAHELRVERSSLMNVNKVLEVESVRLEKDKTDAEDEAAKLDLEKDVLAVVVGDRVGEILKCCLKLVNGKEGVEKRLEVVEREMEVLRSRKECAVRDLKELGEYSLGVEKERDAMKAEVEVRSKEVHVLKERLEVLKSEKGSVVRDLKELGDYSLGVEKERDALKLEAEVRTREVDVLKEKVEEILARENERNALNVRLEKEKSLLNKSLCEALAKCDNLEKQIGGLVMEKRRIELERNESLRNLEQLDKEVCGLRESVLALQAEVQGLQEMVAEFEKVNAELIQQRDGLSFEFAALKEQNKEQIRNLLLEKEMLTRNSDKSASDLENTTRESEKVQASLQAEIAALCEAHRAEFSEMQEMACQLRNKLEQTQHSFETQIEEKKKLVNELKNLRIVLEATIAEKVRAQNDIQLEKKNVQSLTQNLVDLELKVQDSAKEIEQLGNEKSKLIEAKEAVEVQVELLVKEKELVHKKLEEAEEDVIKAKTNTESASALSDKILRMLKKTTNELNASSSYLSDDELLPVVYSDGVKPFESEIEAIKNAFQSREAVMSEMRKQHELMKHSVEEAQKRKSLWQLVSSATTVFAAASVAYLSIGH